MATPLGRQGNRSYYLEDEKIQKKKKRRRNIFRRNQKIIEARKECRNVEERLELVEEV